MNITTEFLEMHFALMRKCGEKNGNAYLLKTLDDGQIRELYDELELPDDKFDGFIKKYREAMNS